ncbi:tryptophan 7-halogenase [Variovorax sp. J2P1-59]|uniref:NAD(P)/FAD-dependent oxidoreductase n=1 Tax=Variovorax flavidus TaxID=3053501 RepID=UPI002574F47A|nr:tryptophan 7-halogenase [Variovorax sp. J2P1-59]MDM0076027.1 tryptophan 7-halogenase [Variovorax sp. J2P1-59]
MPRRRAAHRPMNAAELQDVAIVGAGPAGAALARRLALDGRKVVLIEASRFDRARIGESLSPDIQPELLGLGLRDRFLALKPLPSWGTRSIWGEPAAQARSHLTSPWCSGWHVDRTAFDLMLAEAARETGVQWIEACRVRAVRHDGTAWCVHAGGNVWRSRWIVDATGRSARIARGIGARRMLFDSLVGIAAVCADPGHAERHHLLVEAVEDGWWYSAPLPGGPAPSTIAMLMTDGDLCARAALHRADGWRAAMARSVATRCRVDAAACGAPRVHLAHSHRLLRPTVPAPGPWLAVGDASLAVDPLSGSGVLRALRHAREAATVIGEAIERPAHVDELIASFDAVRDSECTDYLIERAQHYAVEQRFESPFWRRRSRAPAGPAAAIDKPHAAAL